MRKIIVTIDGPAGSGKGRIAKYISRKWGLYHLDSGILYRRLAEILNNKNIDFTNIDKVKKIIKNHKNLSFRKNKNLRIEKISNIASKIAVFRYVRKYINKLQNDFVIQNVDKKGFVIDGRDIGSVVFINADLKLYIDVDVKIRAKRRYKQLIDIGEKSIYRQILKDIRLRDKLDKNRKNSPLVIPKGAYVIKNESSLLNTYKKINKLIEKIQYGK